MTENRGNGDSPDGKIGMLPTPERANTSLPSEYLRVTPSQSHRFPVVGYVRNIPKKYSKEPADLRITPSVEGTAFVKIRGKRFRIIVEGWC